MNAVVGKRFDGEPKSVLSDHGLGERNKRGQMMVERTMMENLAIMGTMYRKRDEHLWTYKNGGRRRQIDSSLVDQGARKEAANLERTRETKYDDV